MSTAQLILWVISIAVGISCFRTRNPTALALVLAFAVSEAGLPLNYYAWSDVVVISIAMAKFERSPADWFIIACYPLAWLSYVFDTPFSHAQWWHLFWIAVLQFFAVGADTLQAFFRARSSIVERHLGSFTDSLFAAFRPVFFQLRATATSGGGDD